MNTKLQHKVKLVCHGQALLGRASISYSPPTCRGVHSTISTKNLRNSRLNICFSSSLWPSMFLSFLCGKVVKLKTKARKPSDIPGKDAFSQKLFFAKRTQFERPKSVASNCCRKVYDALQTKRNEPKRTQLKPIKANLRHLFHGESRHKDSGCPAAKKRLR